VANTIFFARFVSLPLQPHLSVAPFASHFFRFFNFFVPFAPPAVA
jgi:hypothetical protein